MLLSPVPIDSPPFHRTVVTVEWSGERPTVRKQRTGASDVALTAAEARWLRDAAGPGVVELHDHDPDADALITAYAGPRTLASAVTERRSPPAATVIAWLRSVSATLDRIHRAGLIHGQVRPDHVVVAGRAAALISPRVLPRGDGASMADDLAGLGSLVTHAAWVWAVTGTREVDADVWRQLAESLVGGEIVSAARAVSRLGSISPGPG
ncbi:MAG: hypothetical protein ACRBI6_15670 [Acidimicrobiales bacterium]